MFGGRSSMFRGRPAMFPCKAVDVPVKVVDVLGRASSVPEIRRFYTLIGRLIAGKVTRVVGHAG